MPNNDLIQIANILFLNYLYCSLLSLNTAGSIIIILIKFLKNICCGTVTFKDVNFTNTDIQLNEKDDEIISIIPFFLFIPQLLPLDYPTLQIMS